VDTPGRVHDVLLRHRWLALLGLLATTALLVAGIGRFRFDNSYRLWFIDDDPALVAYDAYLEQFGSDEALVIGMATAGAPLSEATLTRVRAISDALAEHPEVLHVWSLTHIEALVSTGGALEARRLVEQIPPSDLDRRWLEGLLEASPIYSRLVSPDRTATFCIASLAATDDSFEPKMALVRDVRQLVVEVAPDRETWLSGPVVLDEAFYRYSADDTRLFAPIILGVMAIGLALLFRSALAVILPLVVVGLSLLWALGLMCWMGWEANVVSTVLPPLLIAVGVADSVHLLQQLRLHARRGLDPDAALREAFRRVLRPCLLTTLTTSAGMASFSVASLAGIRELGLLAAFGVLAAFIWTMIGLPVALSLLPSSLRGGLASGAGPEVPRLLVATAAFATRRRVPVALTGAALVAVAGIGLLRLDVGTEMSSYLWPTDPVFQDALVIDAGLGGSLPAEVLIEAPDGRDLLDPAALERIRQVGDYLEGDPTTGTSISSVDFLAEARRVLLGLPPEGLQLPASRAEAAQLLLLTEGTEEIGRFLSFDYTTARVEVPVRMGSYQGLVDRLPEVMEDLDAIADGVVTARVTGLVRLLGGMEVYLLATQVRSFGLAFILVLGCITLFFRSWRAGLLSAIPNLFPLVCVLGLMGLLDIRLSMTTVMVAPLLLGLVVDDTVHMLERVLHARGEGQPVDQAFRTAVQEVGHAVLITSVILACGLVVPALGSFRPNFHFATLSAVAVVLALLGDLLLFPAIGSLLPGLLPGRTIAERPTTG
jgi:uncharacterized protein